jgi:hypothetical protein|tara:strand:- start:90 stop:701 length:612 start_codon:yes stop_codon:yes gene_type:complete
MTFKSNYECWRTGQKDGEIILGHISNDQQIYSLYLNNYFSDSKHYIAMVQTGEFDWQKDSFLCRSEGSFQIVAGDRAKNGTPGVKIDANSGDIILQADRGRIKLIAKDIELVSSGDSGTNGNIRLKANEKITLDAGQMVDIHGKVSVKIFSDKDVEVMGRNICNLIGNFVNMCDGSDAFAASIGHGRKGGSATENRQAATMLA